MHDQIALRPRIVSIVGMGHGTFLQLYRPRIRRALLTIGILEELGMAHTFRS